MLQFLLLPYLALAAAQNVSLTETADCASSNPSPAEYNWPLHIASIFILLFVSLLGSITPIIYQKFRPPPADSSSDCSVEDNFLIKLGALFGAGTLLSTGFIHMLLPAIQSLTNPCLGKTWSEDYTAFAGLFAVLAILFMQLIQFSITTIFEKNHVLEPISSPSDPSSSRHIFEIGSVHLHHNAAHAGHLISTRSAVALLVIGIVVHSVIIGSSLGVSSGQEFDSLLIAISFHQFFEGIALGTSIVEAQFNNFTKSILLAMVYIVTTPVGIAIGMSIHQSFNPNSPSSLLTQGILDSISAGILIYTSLITFINAQIIANSNFKKQIWYKQLSLFLALYAGVAAMAIIGRWA